MATPEAPQATDAPRTLQLQRTDAAPGTAVDPKVRRSVVSLWLNQSFCTGTWISPHAVLTAAHCVEDVPAGAFFIVPTPDATAPTLKIATGGNYIHPTYDRARKQPQSADQVTPMVAADFAVVVVPGGMPADSRPVVLDFETTVQKDQQIQVAGYGQTGTLNGASIGLGVLRQGAFRALYKFSNPGSAGVGGAGGAGVGAVSPGAGSVGVGAGSAGAGGPGGAGVGGGSAGYYWTLDGEDRVQACRGDSGGPAFWTSEVGIVQFGVNSYIVPYTRDDLPRLQRVADNIARGTLNPPEDLQFYSSVVQRGMRIEGQGCSRLLTVASIGEHRDWITGLRDQIEREAEGP